MSFGEESGEEQGKQNFKYNGKEMDKEHGLNQYDYAARFMDPGMIRFTTVDPLAEFHYDNSPYTYVLNNPLKYIDINGMDTTYVNRNGEELVRIPGGEDIKITSGVEVTVSGEKKGLNWYTTVSLIGGLGSSAASTISDYNKNYTDWFKQGKFPLTYNGKTNLRSLNFLGNKYVSSSLVSTQKANFLTKTKFLKGLKVTGHMLTVGNIAIDGFGAFNYYKNPNSSHIVTPTKFGINTAIVGASYWIPSLGVTHVLMDNLYPGGWEGWADDMNNLSEYADPSVMYGPKM